MVGFSWVLYGNDSLMGEMQASFMSVRRAHDDTHCPSRLGQGSEFYTTQFQEVGGH